MLDKNMIYKLLKTTLIFMIVLGSSSFAQKAWKLDLDGGVKDEDSKLPLEGAKVELYKDGNLIKSVFANGKGKFSFLLDPDQNYTVKVLYKGFISKIISVSSEKVPEKTNITENFFVKMEVSLFKEVPDIDFSVLEKPIGSIFYDKAQEKFGYDVDYELSKKLEQLQKDYDKKLKERLAAEKNAADEALKKQAAEKAAAEKAALEAKKNAQKNAAQLEKEAKKKAEKEEEERLAKKKAELDAIEADKAAKRKLEKEEEENKLKDKKSQAQAEKEAKKRAEKEEEERLAKKQAELDAIEAEKEAKRRAEKEEQENKLKGKKSQEEAEKEAKRLAREKEEADRESKRLALKEEAEKKIQSRKSQEEAEKVARELLAKENKEKAEERRKRIEEEAKDKVLKAREAAEERKRLAAERKKSLVESAMSKPEAERIPVENIRTSQSEGVNYHIDHTFITLMGEEIEYRKIIFTWGGVYFKRAGLDISNGTYVQEMRMFGVEIRR
jgi:hypothetical protein